MNTCVNPDILKQLAHCEDITALAADELLSYFHEDKQIGSFLPEEHAVRDPRTGNYIVYNARRASRPKDNDRTVPKAAGSCPICSGKTTGIVDLEKLSDGYTFINKNLYPILFPHQGAGGKGLSTGFHFLQWTSSNHQDNWVNMSVEDLAVVFGRLAALERWLLGNRKSFFPETGEGWVSIIKNYGRAVGGSLEHDHQQIGFSSVMPGQVRRNMDFLSDKGVKFPEYLVQHNPEELTVRDYGKTRLVIPYYMQRPLNMTLVVNDCSKDFLFELDESEILSVVRAWSDAVYAIMEIMPSIGREPAFNIISNTGSGVFFEFLPYTQELGGFEHSGLYLCQMTPQQAQGLISEKIRNRGEHTA